MNTQQKIDCLNTIINERESAVWLKEILQDALAYLDEKGDREGRLKALDAQAEAKQKDVDGLAAVYHAKEAELRREYEAVSNDAEAQKAKLVAAYLKHEEDIKAKTANLDATLATLQDNVSKTQAIIFSLAQQQEKAETMLAQAKKQYEAYKASLV